MVILAFADDLINTLLDWFKIGHNIHFGQSAGSSHGVKTQSLVICIKQNEDNVAKVAFEV